MHVDDQQPSIPSPSLLALQAQWLSAARARLLRRADIARRRIVVDVAAGSCAVSPELARRSGGKVIAIDASIDALRKGGSVAHVPQVVRIGADAAALPLADSSVDLVLVQCGFLWFDRPKRVAAEIVRVLRAGGALAAIEPDYGGLIEHPPEIALKDVWLATLLRSGADPLIGRKLPALFSGAGLSIDVQLLERLEPPRRERFDLLEELPLTDEETARVQTARQRSQNTAGAVVVHLPFFLVLGEKPR